MRIGELAKKAGMQASAIRYYEQIGLLPAASRSEGGMRRYDEQGLERLLLIKGMQALGFPLEEIPVFLHGDSANQGPAVMVETMDKRLAELDGLIDGLQKKREALLSMRAIMADVDARGGGCPDDQERERLANLLQESTKE